jgi:hypothetical protein
MGATRVLVFVGEDDWVLVGKHTRYRWGLPKQPASEATNLLEAWLPQVEGVRTERQGDAQIGRIPLDELASKRVKSLDNRPSRSGSASEFVGRSVGVREQENLLSSLKLRLHYFGC